VNLVDRTAFKALERTRVLTVDRNEPATTASLRRQGELAGGDETLLVREREIDAALESPERRGQSCEADHCVQNEVRLGSLEQLGEIAAGLGQRRKPVDGLRARCGGAELELGMRFDDLQRLVPDRAGSAEERDPFHRTKCRFAAVIRLGTPDDAEGVARVHVETWQAAYAHALPREQLQALSLEEAVERSRRWPPTFVAERSGEILGFVSVGASRDPGTDGELFAIYVHPQHWGTGAGRALIQAGEDELRRLGHHDAVLWVLDDNPRARRFYELAGWSLDGAAREIHIFGFDVAEIRYAKRL
jgi:ribosomal protein S18 acetylase RimI-like enzyme